MISRFVIGAIDAYQRWGGGRRLLVDCNFEPTCSAYAKEAIERHGVWHGGRLAWSRICRCTDRDRLQPIPDPVPDRRPGKRDGIIAERATPDAR